MITEQFEICNKELCTGCGACAQICALNCILMTADDEGFIYPAIDFNRCISCNKCRKVCPVNSPVTKTPSQFYMAWHNSSDVLLKSSSGGIFTSLANYIFEKKGVVFGVAQNPEKVYTYHVAIENADSLDKLRKSKYYQSDTLLVYKEVKNLLAQGRWVLFTGTACQIVALQNVLGNICKDTLVTMDVLCHGITSSKVIRYYLADMENIFGKHIVGFDFRAKTPRFGWAKSTKVRLHFSDNKMYTYSYEEDLFFPGFNKNLFLRESCYHCSYCGTQRVSDFTAADFWGIDRNSVSKEQLYNGISLLLVNTEKGNHIKADLSDVLYTRMVDAENLIPKTSLALTRPCDRPKERDIIFSMFARCGYVETLHKLIPQHFKKVRKKKYITTIIGERGYQLLKMVLHK